MDYSRRLNLGEATSRGQSLEVLGEIDVPRRGQWIVVWWVDPVVVAGSIPDYVQLACVTSCAPRKDSGRRGRLVDLVGARPCLPESLGETVEHVVIVIV